MTDNFFPEDVKEAADKMGNDFIKAVEFEGEGLVLQLAKPVEKKRSFNPKYGAQETDFLVQKEILEEGETFHFVFNTPEGAERKFDSKSSPFFIGFKQAGELAVGDWVRIVRTGKTDKTRYQIEKVAAPENVKPVEKTAPKAEYPAEDLDGPQEDINPDDIPF